MGHAARIVEISAYKVLVGKPEGKRSSRTVFLKLEAVKLKSWAARYLSV
jgi:hypothetical protein